MLHLWSQIKIYGLWTHKFTYMWTSEGFKRELFLSKHAGSWQLSIFCIGCNSQNVQPKIIFRFQLVIAYHMDDGRTSYKLSIPTFEVQLIIASLIRSIS